MVTVSLALEVMDKEPRLSIVWPVFLAIGLVAFRSIQVRRWLVAPFAAIWALAAWAALNDIFDSTVRPAIVAEAGVGYVIHLVAATSLALGLVIAGVVRKRAA